VSEVFQSLPWQRALWQPVAAAIRQNRLGHALLLAGPVGIGKQRFALSIAAALWCRSPDAEGQGCGVCADCRQVLSEAHSGFHLLRVEEERRDISIDAVRALTEKLQITSHDGRAKVAIIDPADALNTSGINALLKTIEEPSPGSHLLLISERPQALPATLRSRCQRLRFAPPPPDEAQAWLQQQNPSADNERMTQALVAARGAPLRALALLENQVLQQQADWARSLLDLAAGRAEPVPVAASIGDINAAAFIHWLYGWLAQLLALRSVNGVEPDDNAQQSLARRLGPALLDRYIAEVQESLCRVLSNANKVLLLESLLIGWVGLLARSARNPQNAA
jgi:DNA polymerase III subunit delta'